jgi:hypothetical protein
MPVVSTPSGGFHVYYRQPTGRVLGNREGALKGKGINIRGSGGYVIGPGAIRSDGRSWQQESKTLDLLTAFTTGRIPLLPNWLRDLITAGRPMASADSPAQPPETSGQPPSARDFHYAKAVLDDACRKVAEAPQGTRNNTLNISAFAIGTLFQHYGLSREEADRTLTAAALAAGLDPGEIKKTLKSGLDSGMKSPRPPLLPSEILETVSEFAAQGQRKFQRPPQSMNTSAAPVIASAASLRTKVFDPIKYIVRGYLAEGCTILAGRPKLGKSWLMLDIGLAVAGGSDCLGGIKCEEGDVLYLALEDNERRLQSRILKLLGFANDWPTRFHYATQWPRANDGGLNRIREWIRASNNPRLVVVDVLAMFRSPRSDKQSLYDSDYESVQALQRIASETGVAIVIVHHLRKTAADVDPFEKVSGTLGLSGAADTVLILDRDSNGASLYGRGRDIEEIETAVQFDSATCRWRVLGEVREVRRTDERSTILAVLKDAEEPLSPAEIAATTGMRSNNVRQLLLKMATAGEVRKRGRARYIHPERDDLDNDASADNNDNEITVVGASEPQRADNNWQGAIPR